MNLKPLILTVGALGAAAIAVHLLNRPASVAPIDARLGQPVLTAEVAEKAHGLKLQQNGQTVELRKGSDGTWVVTSYFDLEVDFSRLSQLTESLANAKWKSFVTSNPERLKRLELENLRIALLDEKGMPSWTLQVGKNFEGGGRFARLGDEPKAFVTDLAVWVDTEAKNWADTALLKVKPEEIQELHVPFADGTTLHFRRDKAEGDFTAEGLASGQQPKKSQLSSALSSLANVRFSQTLDPTDAKATAAASHARDFRLKTFAGQEFVVSLRQAPAAPIPTPPPSAPGEATPPPAPPAENPAFVVVTDAKTEAPLNSLMKRRAFEVYPYVLTSLPKEKEAWLEAVSPPPAAAPSPAPSPATK